MTSQELALFREQYPQYDAIEDTVLIRMLERRFPYYRSKSVSDVDEIINRYDTNGSILSSYFELKRLKNASEIGNTRRNIAENLLALERIRAKIRQEAINTQYAEEEVQMKLEYQRIVHENQMKVAIAAIEAGVPIDRYADFVIERMRGEASLEKARMEFEQTILLAITSSQKVAKYMEQLLSEIDDLELKIEKAQGDAKKRLERWHQLKLKEYNDALEQRVISPLDGNKS